jgi:nitroreductase
MDFEEVVYKRRTIRRFKQKPIKDGILRKLIDYARLAPVGNNIQAIEYIIIKSDSIRKKIFPCLRWAASLSKEQRNPETNRRPMAYIIVLVNKNIRSDATFSVGAAVENILLGAVHHRLGCCWMGAIDRQEIRELLDISENYDIKHVISIGYPDEKSIIEPFEGSFKYWKDAEGSMHVPKRELNDVILKFF